jgi:electron transport complex protein RnfG
MSAPASQSGPVRTVLVVTLCAGLAALLIGLLEQATRERIRDNRFEHAMRQVSEVLPGVSYDNDPATDSRIITDPGLPGGADGLPVYFARTGTEISAAVFTVVASDGYVGPIRLLIGIDRDGRILRVRVNEHRETPGLGDGIEVQRSDWIGQFDQRDTGQLPALRLRRDGGELDQLTGATVTSRAVAAAVANTLQWYAENGATLLAQATAPTDQSL